MRIGIIGAMDEELAPIRQIANHSLKTQKGNRTFWADTAYGHEIFLTRCDPGKVNAAIATQQLIDFYSIQILFNMGGSGALTSELEVGDLVIASEAIQHDFDLTGWGLRPGELIFDVTTAGNSGQLHYRSQQVFKSHPGLSRLALEAAQQVVLTPIGGNSPKVHTGRILSGDAFINRQGKVEELWNTFHGVCTDMEAAAIAHTCSLNNVPFLCIRSISDKADHAAAVSFTDFLVAATANYGKIFEIVIKQADSAF